MIGYSENENFFLRWFGRLADVIVLSLLWTLCSLPLVTMGAATIALYDAIAQCIHGNHESPCKYFFHVFKTELLRGILITLVWAALGVVLYLGYAFLHQWGQTMPVARTYSMVYLGTLLIPVAIFCWLIPLESRFSYGFFGLHKEAATFVIVHLPTTGIMLGVTAVAAVITIVMPALIILLPGLVVTLHSYFAEKVFKQYIDEDVQAEEQNEEEQNDHAE
jgi:uncharacterized membrane protein YesL